MDTDPIWRNVVSAIVFAVIGLFVFAAGFWLLDRMTPKIHFWRSINEGQNLALAVFLGSIALGIAMIISAAIHG